MDFTTGKRRQYERLMKEKPSFIRDDEMPEEHQREPRRPKRQSETGSRAKKRSQRRSDS